MMFCPKRNGETEIIISFFINVMVSYLDIKTRIGFKSQHLQNSVTKQYIICPKLHAKLMYQNHDLAVPK